MLYGCMCAITLSQHICVTDASLWTFPSSKLYSASFDVSLLSPCLHYFPSTVLYILLCEFSRAQGDEKLVSSWSDPFLLCLPPTLVFPFPSSLIRSLHLFKAKSPLCNLYSPFPVFILVCSCLSLMMHHRYFGTRATALLHMHLLSFSLIYLLLSISHLPVFLFRLPP